MISWLLLHVTYKKGYKLEISQEKCVCLQLSNKNTTKRQLLWNG